MIDVNEKDELEKKALKAVSNIYGRLNTSQITPKEALVATEAVIETVIGLVSEDTVSLLIRATKDIGGKADGFHRYGT